METVDLGLPSGLLWAKCNVGAEKETEYGNYFLWGSTVPNTNDNCDWVNAPFNNGFHNFDQEYFDSVKDTVYPNSVKDTVCPNGVLAPEYDPCHQVMGGGWRTPTKEDFNELLAFTSDERVEDYQGSGINGRLFTSNINGNSIFIPFPYQLSDITHLWTSSLWKERNDSAAAFYIRPHYDGINFCERYYRCNIRAVKEKK